MLFMKIKKLPRNADFAMVKEAELKEEIQKEECKISKIKLEGDYKLLFLILHIS